MKVTDVTVFPLAIPLRPAPPASAWLAATSKQILVRLRTDDGLTGWGECFAYGAPLAVGAIVDEALAPMIVGQDPTRMEQLLHQMHRD